MSDAPSQFYGDAVAREQLTQAVPVESIEEAPELPDVASMVGEQVAQPEEAPSPMTQGNLAPAAPPQPQAAEPNYSPEIMRYPPQLRQSLDAATTLTALAQIPGASKELLLLARAKQQETKDHYQNFLYGQLIPIQEQEIIQLDEGMVGMPPPDEDMIDSL